MTDQLDAIRQQRQIPHIGNDEDVVLPFLEWCALAGLPEATARLMRGR